jgi:hypothetical protein
MQFFIRALLIIGLAGILEAAAPVTEKITKLQSGVVLTFDDQFIEQ